MKKKNQLKRKETERFERNDINWFEKEKKYIVWCEKDGESDASRW